MLVGSQEMPSCIILALPSPHFFLFFSSSSEDGTVVVTGLQPGANGEHTAPEVYSYGAKWPMLAVKLDPLYARRYARGRPLP